MRKGAGIVAVVGALAALLYDFGGWYTRSASEVFDTTPSAVSIVPDTWYFWSVSESYGAVSIASPYAPLLLILIALLGFTAYLAFRGRPRFLPPRTPLWVFPAAAFVLTVLYAFIFMAVMVVEDPDDWWLDTGFYLAAVASLISAFLISEGRLVPAD